MPGIKCRSSLHVNIDRDPLQVDSKVTTRSNQTINEFKQQIITRPEPKLISYLNLIDQLVFYFQ